MVSLQKLRFNLAAENQSQRHPCKANAIKYLLYNFVIVVILFFLAYKIASSQQQHPSPAFQDGNVLPKELYGKMLQTIRDAETLSYESSYLPDISEPNTICKYHIWLKKPNYFYIEGVDFEGNEATYVGDGEHAYIYWPSGRLKRNHESIEKYEASKYNAYLKYAALKGRYSISHKMTYLGLGWGLTVIDPSVFMGYTDAFDSDAATRYLYHGRARIGDEDCHIIEVVYLQGQRSRILWISSRDLLPRMLRDVAKFEDYDGIIQETWHNITLNEELPSSKFSWNPPSGWLPLQLPTWKDKVLKVGTLAPDFDLMTTTGRKLKRSDFRGKTVWLVFWRVGCPPCRAELPYLEQIYRKYKHLDFTVIGFNFSDSRKFAVEFFKNNDLTFPTILDTSEEAIRTGFFTYGATLAPMSYLIDANETIQYVFAGESYDPNSELVTKLQKMLGL